MNIDIATESDIVNTVNYFYNVPVYAMSTHRAKRLLFTTYIISCTGTHRCCWTCGDRANTVRLFICRGEIICNECMSIRANEHMIHVFPEKEII